MKVVFKTVIAPSLQTMSVGHLNTVGRISRHLPSSVLSRFQDGGNYNHFAQIERLFSDKQNR